MKRKAFPEANLPEYMQEKADRMNLDESLVPPFEILPLPFTPGMGEAEKVRRKELCLQTFATELYGEIPPRCQKLEFIQKSGGSAFNGKAVRKEFDIICTNNGISRTLHLLLYTPAGKNIKSPCFLGLNFLGNFTTVDDPEVTIHPFVPFPDQYAWLAENRSTDPAARGCKAHRWNFEKVIDAGFASATICLGDSFPDHPTAFSESIMPLFYSEAEYNSPRRKSSAISAWAWSLMRGIDLLESLPEIDSRKIIVHGLSRQGKTAIWAGANDQRIAMTVSFCSGTAGAKMSRRYFGESIEWLDNWRKYWFVPGFERFVGKDTGMPFDQHQLMSLIAPRKLYVASAENDMYADPKGEFLATINASAAWGNDGIDPDAGFPVPASGLGEKSVRYFIRHGEHDCTTENWDDLLKFAKKHFI